MELTMEQLKELITSTVNEALKPLTQVDRKYGMFPGVDPKEDAQKSYEEKVLKFFRAIVSGDTQNAKALAEGTDSSGGFVVPDEFRNEVIRLVESYGLARKLCRVVPMKRDTLRVPKLTTGVSIYWVGETETIPESSPQFGMVALYAKKAAGLLKASNELLEDADIDVVNFFQVLFAEALAKEEDKQFLVGDGNPFVGILNHPDVNVVTMGTGDTAFSKVDEDDLLDLIDAVSDAAERDAVFFFHKNILTYLRKLKDSNGQPIWDRPGANIPGAIWGEPYYKSGVMPKNTDSGASKKFIIYGNPKQVYFGDKKEMTLALSTERYMEQDVTALRVTERVSIEVAIGDAFSVLKTAAS